MIIVTAATGTVGSEVVKQLSEAGVRCKALVHDRAKEDFVRHPNVEIVSGDFARPETLLDALAGVTRVFLASPPNPQQPEMEGNVIHACQQAGVQCVVKLSVLGAALNSDVPYCQWNAQAERHLQQSGLGHTILQPNSFMQDLLQLTDVILSQHAIYLPLGDARISHIDARDVAAVAVACLTQRDCRNETHVLTGPQAITFSDCANTLSMALGRPIRYQPISADDARAWLQNREMPEWQIDSFLKGAAFYLQGHGAMVTNEVETLLNRPPISFARFARDYAPIFLKATPEADTEIRKAA